MGLGQLGRLETAETVSLGLFSLGQKTRDMGQGKECSEITSTPALLTHIKHGSGNAESISLFFTEDSLRLFSLLLIDACPKFHSFALHLFSFHYLLDPIDYPLNCHIPFSCWFPQHFSDWLLLSSLQTFQGHLFDVTERMRFGI